MRGSNFFIKAFSFLLERNGVQPAQNQRLKPQKLILQNAIS